MLRGEPVEDFDPEIRQLVRVAAELTEGRSVLTPERRAALKARILRRLDETAAAPSLGERVAGALGLLSRPLALASRVAVAMWVVAMLAASATVAGAESLPDEPLYGWKLAVEQTRLALAQGSEDRAAVELSLAEHRLREAVALASRARDAEADAATSAFGAHVAAAAAHLQESRTAELSSVAEQLRENLARQQAKFAEHLRRVASATRASSAAVEALGELATSVGAGKAIAADRIAEAAARTAERAAASAEERLKAEPSASNPAPLPRAVTTKPEAAGTSSGGAKPEAAGRPVPVNASQAEKQQEKVRTERERADRERAEAEKGRSEKERFAKERAKAEQAAKAAKEAAKRAREAAERAKKAKKGRK